MATLTETAYYARNAIKFSSVGFVVLLILWWTGTGLVNLWIATHPEPEPAPAAGFGTLPLVEFPLSEVVASQYQLETPDGTLGTFPDRMRVFLSPAKKSSFLASDNAAKLAAKLGFTTQPNLETSTTYRWSVLAPLPGTLEMDIVNTHFSLKRTWSADPSLVTDKRFISNQQVILDARAFLNNAGLVTPDLVGGEKVTYLQAQGDQFMPTIALSEADFVKVDFFRTPYSPTVITPSPTTGSRASVTKTVKTTSPTISYPFYTPKIENGLISVIVSGSKADEKRIVDVNYRYTPIEYESFSDYPLKTVQQAWEELNAGKGYLASFKGQGVATVRRINLGYFDPLTPHQYIMPIYIFSGDGDLVAYVSAIDNAAISAVGVLQ